MDETRLSVNHQAFESGVYLHCACPDEIYFIADGGMICAFRFDFVNLQESIAAFGRTETEACESLIEMESK